MSRSEEAFPEYLSLYKHIVHNFIYKKEHFISHFPFFVCASLHCIKSSVNSETQNHQILLPVTQTRPTHLDLNWKSCWKHILYPVLSHHCHFPPTSIFIRGQTILKVWFFERRSRAFDKVSFSYNYPIH